MGAIADDGKFRVDRSNRKNIQLWMMQMEDYFYQKDLWKPLEGKTKNHGSMSNAEWDILDRKALGSIQLCLEPTVAFNITKARIIEELMETLRKLYEKPSTSNKVDLLQII